eukprot:3941151-Rhodomonas_salina.1
MRTNLQLTSLEGAGCERRSSCQEGRTVEKLLDQSTGSPAQSSSGCSTLQLQLVLEMLWVVTLDQPR